MKSQISKYIAGRTVINGKEHFVGEIGKAAKNLFIWQLYSMPLTNEEANEIDPIFLKKGRAKSLDKAETDLFREYEATVKPMLEAIKLSGILDDLKQETINATENTN